MSDDLEKQKPVSVGVPISQSAPPISFLDCEVSCPVVISAGQNNPSSCGQKWFVGFQVVVVLLLVGLVSAKMIIDMVVETTILQQLRDRTLTAAVSI